MKNKERLYSSYLFFQMTRYVVHSPQKLKYCVFTSNLPVRAYKWSSLTPSLPHCIPF